MSLCIVFILSGLELNYVVKVNKKFPLIKRPTPIIDFLKTRPTVLLEESLVKKLGLNAQVVGVRGIDAELERLKEAKKAEWRARGYSEGLINMATELAQDWAYRMSEVFAPPELREAAVRYNLPKGLEVADRWITAIGEAAKRS